MKDGRNLWDWPEGGTTGSYNPFRGSGAPRVMVDEGLAVISRN
jgi:hypothetical protein